MAKITINGEVFQYDRKAAPMSEALALEKALDMRYGDYEKELEAGSMRALCAFVWTVWRRNGRDILLEDLLEGKVDFDIIELSESLQAAVAEEAKAEAEENPTVKVASSSTAPGTPRSSRTSTTSDPGKSRS